MSRACTPILVGLASPVLEILLLFHNTCTVGLYSMAQVSLKTWLLGPYNCVGTLLLPCILVTRPHLPTRPWDQWQLDCLTLPPDSCAAGGVTLSYR